MKSFMHKFRINAGSEVRSTVYTQTSPTNIAAGEIQDGSGTPGLFGGNILPVRQSKADVL